METSCSRQKEAIWSYVLSNHVLGITAFSPRDMWSANLFYAGDLEHDCVYVMSGIATRHGQLMQQQSQVSGTICAQIENVAELKGIQFQGLTSVLSGGDYDHAMAIYQKRFPIAEKMKETLWKISFTIVKYTDNSLGFGTKLIWEK